MYNAPISINEQYNQKKSKDILTLFYSELDPVWFCYQGPILELSFKLNCNQMQKHGDKYFSSSFRNKTYNRISKKDRILVFTKNFIEILGVLPLLSFSKYLLEYSTILANVFDTDPG